MPKRPMLATLAIGETPMPTGALGQLFTDDGRHVGWLVKTSHNAVVIAEVRNGMLLLGHAARDLLPQYEGKRIAIIEVQD